MEKQVQYLLRIIRFSLPLIILILSTFIMLFIYNEQKRELKEEHKTIEKQFIEDEKERIKARISTIHSIMKNEHKNVEIELKKKLKYDVKNVYRIINTIYKENINQKSKKEIIKEIKTSLKSIRFNKGRSYITIMDMDSIFIMQPLEPEVEGNYVFNYQDGKGNYLIRDIINIAKSQKGQGYVKYYYNKLDDQINEHRKISYVKAIKELDIIIIIGDYIDDFKLDVQERVLKRFSKIKYKDDAYVFAINFDGKIIYHPSNKALNHNIFKENKFSHIKNDYKNLLLQDDKDSESFITLKPKVIEDKNTKETKITYSKRFDEWGWIISTSFKLSDANRIIEKRKRIIERKYASYKKDFFTYGIILIIFLLIISYFMSKLLEKKFLDYKKSLEDQIDENKTQKETLQKAQEVAHMGDWKLDLKTNKVYWSDEIINIFGLSNKDKDNFGIELLKKIMIEDDIPSFENSMTLCKEGKKEHQSIFRIKKLDDKIKWIDYRGRLNNKEQVIIGTVQDITKSKELELEKKQKEELLYQQSKMAAMGEMLGNIAHQWRQPLSTISTASTGTKIQKEMGILTDEQLYDSLTSINDSAQYLSQTIDDFRSFFDPNNSKSRDFHLDETISKALNLVKAQFTAKDIEIIKNIENNQLFSIENELVQVLVNILNNARDILISKEKQRRLIFINSYKREDSLFIEILDNGKGIDKDIIDRIFEPYFTTKHKSKGTGIGLYMSEEIIKNHLNGSLTVSNEKYTYEGIDYVGAKFIIELYINEITN